MALLGGELIRYFAVSSFSLPFSRSHVVSFSPSSISIHPSSFFLPPPLLHLALLAHGVHDGASFTAGNLRQRTVVCPESNLGTSETQKAYPRKVSV